MDHCLDKNKKVPSLPKIYRPTQELVTTRLGEPYYARHDYHIFETSRPKDIPLNFEYNSLQDPNLRYYFNRPHMRERLQKMGLINDNMDVICSMKFYHIFREAMEYEARKLRDKQYDEEKRSVEEPNKSKISDVDDKLRKVRLFKEKQDKAQTYQRMKMQKQSEYDQRELDRRRQEAAKEKQRREIEREAERERKLALSLEREQQLLFKRRKVVNVREYEEQMREIKLKQQKQQRVLHHHAVIAQRFRRWDEHHATILEEQGRRKRQLDEERKKNKAKREKLFRILQNRQEATHQRLLERNHGEVEQLYHEANEREQRWIEKRSRAIHEWQEIQEHAAYAEPPPPPMGCFNAPTTSHVAKQVEEQEEIEQNRHQQRRKKECVKQEALANKRASCIVKIQETISRVLAERAIRSAIDSVMSE